LIDQAVADIAAAASLAGDAPDEGPVAQLIEFITSTRQPGLAA